MENQAEGKPDTKERRIKSIAWFLSGLVVSVVSLFLIGFLSIQIAGLRGGAVFGVDNQLVAVTEPGPGFLQKLGVAAVAGACLALLTLAVQNRPKNVRAMFRFGFAAGYFLQIVVSAVLSSQGVGATTLNGPQRPWAEGWVVEGGMNSAVHLLLIVSIFLLFARPLTSENVPATESDTRFAKDLSRDDGTQP